MRLKVPIDRTDILSRALQSLCCGDGTAACNILRTEYPFTAVSLASRRYTEAESLRIFRRDGFIDRYSGQRLVFAGVFRILSRLLPQEFPFHPNWKMTETHPAFWEMFPTIDHVQPIARGGVDGESNWITTSMLRNSAKANWTLEELGWTACPAGSLDDWDGLTALCLNFIESDRLLLQDGYLQRWYKAAVAQVS